MLLVINKIGLLSHEIQSRNTLLQQLCVLYLHRVKVLFSSVMLCCTLCIVDSDFTYSNENTNFACK